ncbi:MAG TPA: hypothetical protein VGY55_13020, partial [Pirellulales bacterium]|nr:hypothetical protein [Pirellulales bacterium]
MLRRAAPSTAVQVHVHSLTSIGTTASSRCVRRLLSLAILISGLLASSASAGTYYWFGDDNNKWNQIIGPGGTNWSSSPDFNNGTGGATALPSSTSDVFFVLTGAGNLTTELGQSFSINSLTFTPAATSPVQINDTPGTNLLTIGAGGITDNGPSNYTINANVALGASEIWANNTANPITFSGVISGAAANNLTIGGTGVTVLTGADTYAGSTNVFTGTLRVTGANGAIGGTSMVSLGAGTSLVFDNTTNNNNNRIGSATGITSNGGIINLIGNGGVATTQTIGTLTLGPGATVVQSSGTGAVLTLGASGGSPIPSLNRLFGGTVNFVPGSIGNGNINLPNAPTPNGILGGWAVTGTAAGNNLNWATLDGSNNVIPYTGYTQLTADANGNITSGMTGTAQQTANVQYNATGNNSPLITADTTINTLYMTGGSQPIATTNISTIPTSQGTTVQGHVINFSNGITFGNGQGGQQSTEQTPPAVTLTLGAGGIISSGESANSIGYYNNKSSVPNMGFIGYLFGEYSTTTPAGTNTGPVGQITVSPGVPDLAVYTASDGNLRLGSLIVDTPVTPSGITGSTTASLTNGSNIVTLTNGTTAGLVVGESVRNLGTLLTANNAAPTGLVNGVQKITGITDSTHFTIATNANANVTGGTPVFGTSIGLTKSGPGLLDLGNGNTQNFKTV